MLDPVTMYAVKRVTEDGRTLYRYVTAKPDEARWLAEPGEVVSVSVAVDPAGAYFGWLREKTGTWMHVFPSRVLCESCVPPRGGTIHRLAVKELP